PSAARPPLPDPPPQAAPASARQAVRASAGGHRAIEPAPDWRPIAALLHAPPSYPDATLVTGRSGAGGPAGRDGQPTRVALSSRRGRRSAASAAGAALAPGAPCGEKALEASWVKPGSVSSALGR